MPASTDNRELGTKNSPEPDSDSEERFSFRQRFLLWLITLFGGLAFRLLGSTLRYSVSIEEDGPEREALVPAVYAFWHRCVLPASYYFRNLDVAVLVSRSFDGECIACILKKLGYRSVRGSSTRGGSSALLALHDEIKAGRTVAFTIDGPRGPRYLAKPGPVLLARNTQVPIVTMHLAVDRAWVLNSWDAFMIPKPFARVLLRMGKLTRVPDHADGATMDRCHAEMQATLDRIRDFAEANVSNSIDRSR